MTPVSTFGIELIGRIILLAIFWFTLRFGWWVPLASTVIFWQIWNLISPRPGYYFDTTPTDLFKMLADFITFGVYGGYVICSVIVFGRHVGNWYGWAIGLILGLVVVQILGLLWPHAGTTKLFKAKCDRWHAVEQIVGRERR